MALPRVHVLGLPLAVLLHTCITFSIVLLSVQSNIQGMFCPAGFVHTGAGCLHTLKTVEKDTGEDWCPVAFFLHRGSPLRVINTTTGPLLCSTVIQQIPGKYELVSTCAAEANTAPPSSLFFSTSTPFYTGWRKRKGSKQGLDAEMIVC